MKTTQTLILRCGGLLIAAALYLPQITCAAQTTPSAPATAAGATSAPVADQVGAAAADVTRTIQDTGQTALNEVESLWKRIDDRRLKNRTPDELVAWALMGLLVGGLIYRITKLGQVPTIVTGLAGAFLGGILANAFKLNFGIGPVLVRWEDLICSMIGGFVVLFVCGKLLRKSTPASAAKKPAEKEKEAVH